MWRLFRTAATARARAGAWPRAAPGPRAAALLLGSALGASALGPLACDNSANSLAGVAVDAAIDPFPAAYTARELPFLGADHALVASGVRSVTFLGFKVYGVGLYVARQHEPAVRDVVAHYVSKHGRPAAELLADKSVSQAMVADLSRRVPYALKITPVRNTDYGHLRDGLTKSILASPMAKSMREDVARGVEQLRSVFQGHKGSVPKNDTLWVVSDTQATTFVHQGRASTTHMGRVAEPCIAQILLVSYLSSAKPLSEPLRKDFVSYATR